MLLEAVLTLGLIYAYYSMVIDLMRGHVGTIASLAVGLLLGINVLAGAPFDGAGMNPARIFDQALVGCLGFGSIISWDVFVLTS